MNTRNILPIDVVLYSPYNISLRKKDFLTEDEFFTTLFIEISKFKDEKDRFKKYLSDGEGRVPIAILSGYSGSGKTTFINWLRRSMIGEGHFFKILNVNDTPKHNSYDSKLLAATIEGDLQSLLLNKCSSLAYILEHYDKFIIHFENFIIPLDKPIINETAGEQWRETTVMDEVEECYEILKIEQNSKKVKVNAIKRLTSKLNFRHLLLIYILEYILIFDENDDKHSYIFCFDNIDQLKYEYLSLRFWDDFYSVWKILQTIANEEEEYKVKFDFENKFKFLIVLRESNLSLTYSMNPQLRKNLNFSMKTRRCILSGEIKDILNKRISFIYEHIESERKTNNLTNLLGILDGQKYREFAKGCLLPLFNYDYRHFFTTIDSITDNDNEQQHFIIDHIALDVIKSIGRESISTNLSKGIILLPIIAGSCKNQFLKLIPSKSNGCRLPRLILTVLFNLTYPNGLSDDLKFKENIEPGRVSIRELFKIFCTAYTVKEFLENLRKLCYFNEDSWAHLVSFYNVRYNSENELVFSDYISNLLTNYKENGDDDVTEFDYEKDVYLHFNASAYAYLRYIITHFEYFSFLATYQSSKVENKPLAILAFEISYNKENETWEYAFEHRIKNVLQVVATYKKLIDSDFSQNRFKAMTEREYTKSDFCFGESSANREFYMTRVVTTHIRYIDDFRKFIYCGSSFDSYYKTKSNLSNLKNKMQINKYLITVIIEYLDILATGVIDPTIVATSNRLRVIATNELNRLPDGENWRNIEI
jgi:hypothetical protein